MRNGSDLRALVDFLQAGGEREKAALARELHDSLGGILTPAKMDIAWLKARLERDPQSLARLAQLEALIDEGIELKRRIIESLRPSLLDHLGLAAALKWHAENACRSARLDCHLHVSDDVERLPLDTEIVLFRVAQESLANVLGHASASCVDITFERTRAGTMLTVADDGVGIANVAAACGETRGLAAMQQRMRSIGGRLEVIGRPGRGTRVTAFLPP
jgi:signal transduction histidine kinase